REAADQVPAAAAHAHDGEHDALVGVVRGARGGQGRQPGGGGGGGGQETTAGQRGHVHSPSRKVGKRCGQGPTTFRPDRPLGNKNLGILHPGSHAPRGNPTAGRSASRRVNPHVPSDTTPGRGAS